MYILGHWLAIEGVQPNIPENPIQQPQSAVGGYSSSVSSGIPPIPQAPPMLLQNTTTPSPSSVATNTTSMVVETLEGHKYNVKHHLSKEHQMYYETVTTCLFSKDVKAVQTALHSLQHDAGIQQLLPYFIQFVAEMVQ